MAQEQADRRIASGEEAHTQNGKPKQSKRSRLVCLCEAAVPFPYTSLINQMKEEEEEEEGK
jgi:hypothetical protein